MRWFFLLLPWIELFTLIQLGGQIGALATLAYVFLTLMLGLSIIRLQGMEILTRLQTAQQGDMVVGRLLADDLSMGLAGVLLLIPGLLTDALALLVLIGPLRRRLVAMFRGDRAGPQNDRWSHPEGSRGPANPREPLEGEFRRLDDD